MAELTVHVTLTFGVTADETLDLPRRVADAVERAIKSIEVKDKPGVALVLVSTTSAGPAIVI
jgi:hypothetical protein